MNAKTVIAVLAVMAIATYAGLQIYSNSVARASIDESIKEFENQANVEYGSVHVDLFKQNIHVENVSVTALATGRTFSVEEIVVVDADEDSEFPEFLSMSVRGIEVDVEDLADQREDLKALGYDRLRANIDVDYTYDNDNKHLDINRLGLGADDMGSIEIVLSLGKIDIDPNQFLALIFTYPRIEIHKVSISYEDDSLIQRIIERQARENGTSPEAVVADWHQQLERHMGEAGDEFSKTAYKRMKEFLDNPGKLTVSASPAQPRTLKEITQIQVPSEIISALNLNIQAE